MSKDKPAYQMGPFPWKATKFSDHERIGISDASGAYSRAEIVCNSIREPWAEKDAESIVKAMNNTWGEGVNPEAVPELLRTLNNMCEYFEWLINDPNFPAYREAKTAIEKAKII